MRTFTLERAHALFEDRVRDLVNPTPRAVFDRMFDFYREERCSEAVSADEDGDMLLFQWSTWSFGSRHFQVELVRQLIVRLQGEDTPYQLAATFRFSAEPALEELGKGTRWCHDENGVREFERWLRVQAVWETVADRDDGDFEVSWECAE